MVGSSPRTGYKKKNLEKKFQFKFLQLFFLHHGPSPAEKKIFHANFRLPKVWFERKLL
jgi:hypothetical protein